jgi:CheY-like chemotaxis protein
MMANILVIDDMPEILLLLNRILQGDGHRIFTGANSQEALKFLHRHGMEIVDVVISDNEMANSELSGIELLSRIRRDFPWIKCVLMTSGIEPDLPEGVEFLHKPFDPDELTLLLNQILDE